MKKVKTYGEGYSGTLGLVPLRIVKESPAYEFLLKEAREHWQKKSALKFLSKTLRLMIAQRFPKLKTRKKIKRIHDDTVLKQLCLEVGEAKDAADMRKRLRKAIKAQETK